MGYNSGMASDRATPDIERLIRQCRLGFASVLVQRAGFKPDTPPAIVADWYEEHDRTAIANFLRAIAREPFADADSPQPGR
jgi:hypothetical protein